MSSDDAAANDREVLRAMQKDALWKWRWLGLKNSTPAFKGALVLAGGAIIWIAAVAIRG